MTGLEKLIKVLEEEYERAINVNAIDEVGNIDPFHDGYRMALVRCLTSARDELTKETQAQTMTIKLDDQQFQLLAGHLGVKLPDAAKPITSIDDLTKDW